VVDVAVAARTEDGVELRFEVRDTGIGIPDAAPGTLFEPFQQADPSTTRPYGGPGPGPPVRRPLGELMGGEVRFASGGGGGARFFFTLPFARVAGAGPKPSDEALEGARVLVVDDNGTNRGVLQHRLLSWGAHTGVAADGEAALAELERAARAG